MDPVELILVVYDNEEHAGIVLNELVKLEKSNTIKLVDAAVILKNQAGKTHLRETRDIDSKRGALFGAIAGGVIGLLAGPVGVVFGAAAGAATGGIAAKKIDLGFSDEFLHELKNVLKPGTSAILTVVEQKWVDRALAVLERQGGELFRHAIKSEIVAQLSNLKQD